jgi:hypothetical protein
LLYGLRGDRERVRARLDQEPGVDQFARPQ